MATFVLVADTTNGVHKVDLIDFLAENPDQDFIEARDFIGTLDALEDGETVAALCCPMEHKDLLAEIDAEYGIK